MSALLSGGNRHRLAPWSLFRSREARVVTKKEIVRTLSTEIGMTQMETKEIVQKTFTAIVDALVEGGAPVGNRTRRSD